MHTFLRNKDRQGFTIVELLIVIIVIGILATLILVAYSSVSDQAKSSAAKNDLEQIAKQLNLYKENTGGGSSYPTDASSLTYSNGTSVQYSVNNSVNPATYCVTATNGNKSFFVSNTSQSPTPGGCPGHGVNGQAPVTNMALNPEARSTDGSEWLSRYSMSLSWVTGASDGPIAGLSSYARYTQGSAVTGSGRGIDHRYNLDLTNPDTSTSAKAWPVTSGASYVISDYVRSSIPNSSLLIIYRLHDGAGNWLTGQLNCSATNYATANTWVRLSCPFTATATGYVVATTRFNASVTWSAGATMDGTGLMLTSGSTLYNFGDGNSTNWVWNGTTNSSTSTGPAL